MPKKAIVFVLGLFAVVPVGASAYNPVTHAALTDEIVDFYNLRGGGIAQEEKEWIVQGSIDEDTPPRWVNHFYDPVYNAGWTGENAGNLSPEFVQFFSVAALAPEGPVSSVHWINDQLLQARYDRYGGDQTWKRALEYWADGDKKDAYIALGHSLHLLEDATVPEHTRNDTHVEGLDAFGENGSPYEIYTTKWTCGAIKGLDITGSLSREGATPPAKTSIEEYLKSIAFYSNNYFFSKDTIGGTKYALPKIMRDDGNFGYGLDENGKEFLLVKSHVARDANNNVQTDYSIENLQSYYPVLDAYFSHLSREAVVNGAGAIALFEKQAADAVVNKEFPQHLVVLDPQAAQWLNFPDISVFGEGVKLFNGAKIVFADIAAAGQSAASSVYGLFSGIFVGTNDVTITAPQVPTTIAGAQVPAARPPDAANTSGADNAASQATPVAQSAAVIKTVSVPNAAVAIEATPSPSAVPVQISVPASLPVVVVEPEVPRSSNPPAAPPVMPAPVWIGGTSFSPAAPPIITEVEVVAEDIQIPAAVSSSPEEITTESISTPETEATTTAEAITEAPAEPPSPTAIFSQPIADGTSHGSWYDDNWYQLGSGFSGTLQKLTLLGQVDSGDHFASHVYLHEFKDPNYGVHTRGYTISDNAPFTTAIATATFDNLAILLKPYFYYRLDTVQDRQNSSVILEGTSATGTAMWDDFVYGVGGVHHLYPFTPFMIGEGLAATSTLTPPPLTTPGDLALTFDDETGPSVNFSWSSSSDPDWPENGVHYQTNYSTSSEPIVDGWQDTLGALVSRMHTPFLPDATYNFFVRAVDDFGNSSTIASAQWKFPSEFVPYILSGQVSSIGQDFVLASGGTLKSIDIFTSNFSTPSRNPDFDDCGLRLYDKESGEQITRADNIYVGYACGRGKLTFSFASLPLLESGHRYQWVFFVSYGSAQLYGTTVDTANGSSTDSGIINAKFTLNSAAAELFKN